MKIVVQPWCNVYHWYLRGVTFGLTFSENKKIFLNNCRLIRYTEQFFLKLPNAVSFMRVYSHKFVSAVFAHAK